MIQVIQGSARENKKNQIISDKLSRMEQKGSEHYAARIASKQGLPYIDLHITPLSVSDVFIIPENIAKSLSIICFHSSGKKLSIGTPSPDNQKIGEYITSLQDKKGYIVSLAVISDKSLERGLLLYKNILLADTLDKMRLSLSGDDLEQFTENAGKLINLSENAEAFSTTEILSIVMAGALTLDASDVHIEPQTDHVRLRYRIDGLLRDVIHLPLGNLPTIISRIKMMSNMKINISDEAQDGRFSFDTNDGKKVDVRTSVLPGKKSESIVMRILGDNTDIVGIEEIGLTGKAREDLLASLSKTNGIIITTGPTGSGKTTTLYSMVNHIATEQKKIVTIENPIEYHVSGIVQTEVSQGGELSFAGALRSIVRQDPDVILVGEIRDEDTADVAINAALTGHLVLSTLHTNSAIGTIARLAELGVRPSLIPPAADVFLAQRLVRKLCIHCKETYEPATEVAESIMKMIALISPKAGVDTPTEITELYRPVGCVRCNGTGYKGRVGIFEVLTIGETIEQMILDMRSETEITTAAIEEGFITMTQDGLLKALQGITSVEEVWRVTSDSRMIQDLYDNLMSQSLTRRLEVGTHITDQVEANIADINIMHTAILAAETTDTLSLLFAYAKKLHASDIHIEPGDGEAHIRLRIDGTLQTIATISPGIFAHILTEIKDYANIPTTTRQGVTDSRFGVAFEDNDGNREKADVRTSIIVGGFGETVVMRLLIKSSLKADITELGITAHNQKRILSQAKKPHGMILNTGPTGSGKTTTLYSLLQMIANDTVKVITIEDPIEYQIPGILQTQVNAEEGYTFSTALTALLRQDPDVIFLGEIRDTETAQTGADAAQTGHLVLSTLHTNNAIATIGRLENLNLSREDITASIGAIMAQRLVRKLCSCKESRAMTEGEQALAQSLVERIEKNSYIDIHLEKSDTLYTPGTCKECNGLGYKGRIALSEVLIFEGEISNHIMRGALPDDIESAAKETGMITIEEDGIIKALAGETTIEEVKRVTML